MQLNSLTTGLCACVGLLLALDSIPVAEGNLAGEHSPVEVEGNLAERNSPAEELDSLAEVKGTPVETLVEAVGNLVGVADSPVETLAEVVGMLVEAVDNPVETLVEVAGMLVEGTLGVACVALRNRIVVAHADQDLPHALLQVAVQVVVLLLVVRMVVPGCSYVSPP